MKSALYAMRREIVAWDLYIISIKWVKHIISFIWITNY